MTAQSIETSPQFYARFGGLLVGVLGGPSQIVWLLVKGANAQQWQNRAAEFS